MNRQLIGRRLVLGALAVALAVPGLHAAAVVYGPDDFGDRESFEGYCEDVGGTVEDTGDGNLWCQDFTGGQTVCDTNGNDCYTIPFMPPASDPRVPTGGLGLEPTMNGGGGAAPPAAGGGVMSPMPGIDRVSLAGAQPFLLAGPARELDQDHATSTPARTGSTARSMARARIPGSDRRMGQGQCVRRPCPLVSTTPRDHIGRSRLIESAKPQSAAKVMV